MRGYFLTVNRVFNMLFMVAMFAMTKISYASALDELKALEADKGHTAVQSAMPSTDAQKSARHYSPPDNHQVNVDDYRIVLFMQGDAITASNLTHSWHNYLPGLVLKFSLYPRWSW